MLYLMLILGTTSIDTSDSKRVSSEFFLAKSAIMKIQPKLKAEDAEIITESLLKHSRNYRLNWKILASIIAQESSFRKDPQNCLSGNICPDLGLAQINYKTWHKELSLDRTRLLIDISYNIETMAQILSVLKSKYGKEKNWFTRYHSFTKKHRITYETYLHNHLTKLNKSYDFNKNIQQQSVLYVYH